ncbi:unnamed protein product, partial [Amoebophrya sp. A25]
NGPGALPTTGTVAGAPEAVLPGQVVDKAAAAAGGEGAAAPGQARGGAVAQGGHVDDANYK